MQEGFLRSPTSVYLIKSDPCFCLLVNTAQARCLHVPHSDLRQESFGKKETRGAQRLLAPIIHSSLIYFN